MRSPNIEVDEGMMIRSILLQQTRRGNWYTSNHLYLWLGSSVYPISPWIVVFVPALSFVKLKHVRLDVLT